jgi:hypothetical protein
MAHNRAAKYGSATLARRFEGLDANRRTELDASVSDPFS